MASSVTAAVPSCAPPRRGPSSRRYRALSSATTKERSGSPRACYRRCATEKAARYKLITTRHHTIINLPTGRVPIDRIWPAHAEPKPAAAVTGASALRAHGLAQSGGVCVRVCAHAGAHACSLIGPQEQAPLRPHLRVPLNGNGRRATARCTRARTHARARTHSRTRTHAHARTHAHHTHMRALGSLAAKSEPERSSSVVPREPRWCSTP
jgi:hypothetical protein